MKKILLLGVLFSINSFASAEDVLSFSCFETMANVYSNSKLEATPLFGTDKLVADRAFAEAATRAGYANDAQKTPNTVKVLRDNKDSLYGLTVTIGNDPEYQVYFLFIYSPYTKRLTLLSQHTGDDQGPSIDIFCQGWSEGLLIETF